MKKFATRRKWGENMIKISVNFWTDNLPEGADEKTAWAKGVVHLVAIESRKIRHDKAIFNKMEDFFPKLQELLTRNNIKLIKPPEKINEIDLTKLSSRQ